MASNASKSAAAALASGLLPMAFALTLLATPVLGQDVTPDPNTEVGISADPSLSGEPGELGTSFAEIRDAAVARLLAAAEAGDTAATLALANFYLRVDSTPDEIALGLATLEKAAELGLEEAHLVLGDLYRDGVGEMAPDFTKAAEHYEVAAANGNNDARRHYGAMLLASREAGEVERALVLFSDAVADGDLAAAIALADVYAAGRLVPQQGQKAAALYDLGLPSGSLDAITGLADLYRAGAPDLPKDLAQAVVLYQQAAGLGDRGARRTLADMYIRGEGVPTDLVKGISLLEDLAAIGQASALVDLGDLFSNGEFTEPDGARAVDYYERAAEIGDFASIVRIADIYSSGLPGFAPDLAMAAEFYAEAADDGDNYARKALAEILIDGAPDLEADPARAEELLRDAADDGDEEAAAALAALTSGT